MRILSPHTRACVYMETKLSHTRARACVRACGEKCSPVRYIIHNMMAGVHVMSLAEASSLSRIKLKRTPKVLTQVKHGCIWGLRENRTPRLAGDVPKLGGHVIGNKNIITQAIGL